MKRIIIIAISSLIIYSSCQKGSSADSNYHVSFSANGTNKTYTGNVAARFDTASGYITLTVLGSDTPTSFDNYFGFYLNNYPGAKPITKSQYLDTLTDFTLLANYTLNSVEYDAGQSIATDAANQNIVLANHFKINIASVTNTTISGNFSGDFYRNGDVQSGAKISITNGDFYVQLK